MITVIAIGVLVALIVIAGSLLRNHEACAAGDDFAPRVVCAWCGNLIRDGAEPISHGMCDKCQDFQMAEAQRLLAIVNRQSSTDNSREAEPCPTN